MVMGITIPYMPLGWLSMLRNGFLHRDVSIGNTLMLDPPVKPSVRSIEDLVARLTPQLDPPVEPSAQPIEDRLARLCLQDGGDLTKCFDRLKDAIGKDNLTDKCHGFVIDGDMAARLKGYFTSPHTGERSVSI